MENSESLEKDAISKDGRLVRLEKNKKPRDVTPEYNKSGQIVPPPLKGESLDEEA